MVRAQDDETHSALVQVLLMGNADIAGYKDAKTFLLVSSAMRDDSHA